ncbi:MAG: hypothetical protein WKF77_12945 [Planctomycetaceae bacterium]
MTRCANEGTVAVSDEDRSQSIALLLAETRVLVLRMGRHEFGGVAGMHFHAVKNVETPGGHPQHESFSRVYRTWQRLATQKHGQSSRVKSQLQLASGRLLNLLVPEQDDRGRRLRSTVDGLYRIWMYQSGHFAFEEASRRTNRQRVALTYGTLWQRREVGMVPDFQEVRVIGTHLGHDLAAAAKIWQRQKSEQLLKRGVPSPLVRFIVAIQLEHPGLRMAASSIRKQLQVSERTAQDINNGKLVRFDEIRHVALSVIPKRELPLLLRDWQAAWDCANAREDFTTAFPRICTENGWTNHMLASLLRVRPPEQRSELPDKKKKAARVRRAESYRPSAEVRRMYQENSFSGQVPAKAAIDLVASDTVQNAGTESQKDYLTRLFLEGVAQRLLHKGSGAHGSPVRAHRILCGVTPEQLADISGCSGADILLIERGIKKLSASESRRLIQFIETFPARKVSEARARLAELSSSPVTVSQTVERLKNRHGGYIPLSRLLHDETDRRFSFTPGRLKRIERGQEVPALPLLKYLVTQGGAEIKPELLRNWYDCIPRYLAEQGKLQWTHPLARTLGIVILEKWHNLHHFWEDQLKEDLSYSMLTRNFQQLNGKGHAFPWTTVSRYPNAAGVGLADPRRSFLQQLFHRRDEITRLIHSSRRAALQAIIGDVLNHWRKEMRSAGIDSQAVEYTLGLTPEEYHGIATYNG